MKRVKRIKKEFIELPIIKSEPIIIQNREIHLNLPIKEQLTRTPKGYFLKVTNESKNKKGKPAVGHQTSFQEIV